MASATGKTEPVGDDSSSSDDEALRRCQEAVWEATGAGHKGGDRNVAESKRVVVADHQHDGNELQVTQGFQKHVARKLGSLLDSCISEVQTEASSCVKAAEDDDDDDAGFRLFSTSVPGQIAEEPPAPARRRPLPSSSDSDSEMETRLKEAAVSVKDLVTAMSTVEPPSPEQVKKKKKKRKPAEEEEQAQEAVDVVQKKKKKKQEVSDSAASPLNIQSNGEIRSSEQEEEVQTKQKKKKKKRKREGNTEEDELD